LAGLPTYRELERANGTDSQGIDHDQSALQGKQDHVGVATKAERFLDVMLVELHSFLAHIQDTGDLL